MDIPLLPQQQESLQPGRPSNSINGVANLWGMLPSRSMSYTRSPDSTPTPPQVQNGNIGGYDIAGGWRASSPNHLNNVQSIYNQLQNSTSTIQQDIDRVSSLQGIKSPLNEDMINISSDKYGVDPKVLATAMRADTNYGIHSLTPYNPSNIGNFGSNKVNFKNWQEGVDETARFLSTLKPGASRTFKGLNQK